MARYVVTGGCGFIGSHLVRAIMDRGDTVVALDDLSTGDRSSLPDGAGLVVGDVADPALVARVVAGADGIFHLAAIASVRRCHEAWRVGHRVNATGTVTVLEAARDAGRIPVVYTSSAAVYGDNPNRPLRESERPNPLSAYGADKLASELHAAVAGRIHGVPSFGFRLFNIYGPDLGRSLSRSGVVAVFASRLAAGSDIVVDGDGDQVRDFVHVDDAVDHLLAGMAASDASAPLANLCTGSGTSIRQLAEAIRRLTGSRGSIVHGPPRTADIRISVGDPTFAAERLRRRTRIELLDGLAGLLGREQNHEGQGRP